MEIALKMRSRHLNQRPNCRAIPSRLLMHITAAAVVSGAHANKIFHRVVSDLSAKNLDEPLVLLPGRALVTENLIFKCRATSKYLNNLIGQEHRRIKQRLRPMLGLKSFRTAAVVIGGIELAEKIKKQQFKIGLLGGSKATMPELWQAALAA